VPTGCPFRLPFYGNLPNGLARQLDAAGIPNRLLDNAFVQSGDGDPAQQIGDRFEVKLLHERLDQWVDVYCPSLRQLQEN